MGRCIGRFGRALDEKGRVTLPAKLRKALLGPDETSVVLTPGHDGCIYVHAGQTFMEGAAARISGDPVASKEQRDLRRAYALETHEEDVDRQGRVLIADELCQRAGISKRGRVIVLGVMTFVEIWSLERFKERVEPLRGKLDEFTEKVREEEKS